MAETYTVQLVQPSGKQSAMYGTEYHVKFNESEQTFNLWFKKQPEVGQEVYGTINGDRFKKERKDFQPDENTNVTKKEWTPKTMRNSDGMRQGMCINNAANYVNSQSTDNPLSPEAWAKAVYEHANHLYALGDLTGDTTQAVEEAPQSVKDVFGVGEAVPANK